MKSLVLLASLVLATPAAAETSDLERPGYLLPANVRFAFVWDASKVVCPNVLKLPKDQPAVPVLERFSEKVGLNQNESQLLAQFCITYINGALGE